MNSIDMTMIRDSMLFRGMSEGEIRDALSFLRADERFFQKGAVILHAGSVTSRMGLVMDGSVTIESNDMWGNRTILSHIGKGQFFAESYALLKSEPMLVDVTANEDCRILFLQSALPDVSSQDQQPWAFLLLSNLLMISAQKNLHLTGRSFHISPKTVRGRVMSYLNAVSLRAASPEFDIPFNRQQLADYLNLERTALSKELGRMQREGYFTVRKNHFVLLRTAS